MTDRKDSFDAFSSGNVFTRLHTITPLAGAGLEKAAVADDFLACAICQWHHRQLDAAFNAANTLRVPCPSMTKGHARPWVSREPSRGHKASMRHLYDLLFESLPSSSIPQSHHTLIALLSPS
jgi:hypothetical protein